MQNRMRGTSNRRPAVEGTLTKRHMSLRKPQMKKAQFCPFLTTAHFLGAAPLGKKATRSYRGAHVDMEVLGVLLFVPIAIFKRTKAAR